MSEEMLNEKQAWHGDLKVAIADAKNYLKWLRVLEDSEFPPDIHHVSDAVGFLKDAIDSGYGTLVGRLALLVGGLRMCDPEDPIP